MQLPTLPLPDGLTARGATMDDVDAVVEVARAAERADAIETLTTRADIAGDWARPSMDLAVDTCVVEADGRVVAYGEQFQGRAYVHVHPDAHGRGIGTVLAAWTEDHARWQGLEQVGQTLANSSHAAKALVESRGYVPRWDSWVLKMPLDGWDAPPSTVTGVSVRALRRPEEDREVHDVVETAFATWPDRNLAMTFEDWRVSYLDRAEDVDLVLVAEEGGRLVGAAVCAPEEDEGWVDQLAVLPDHWGRGIGGALLQAAFRAFRDRGLAVAALSTDSRTGALGLYEHVGMTVVESYTRWTRNLT